MANEINLNGLKVVSGGAVYNFKSIESIYSSLDITEERFLELLARDFHTVTLSANPTSSTVTYTDTDGSVNTFQIGQFARVADSTQEGGYKIWQCVNNNGTTASWVSSYNVMVSYVTGAIQAVEAQIPTKVSQLTNDKGYLTEHQDISGKQDVISDLAAIRSGASLGATALQSIPSEYVTETELTNKGYATTSSVNTGLSGKVDKVSGKGLSTNDFTTALKTKLEGLSNYDDTELDSAITSLQNQFNTLVSGDADSAIESFNEIIAFLEGVQDTETLEGIIASIEQQISGKQATISDLSTIRSGAALGATAVQPSSLSDVATSGSYSDLSDKPTIPSTLSALTDDASHRTVTDTEKAAWNAKSNFSGSYNDLSNKPSIPTVNNATLTIQKNGTSAGTFTANASENKIINITVPTKTSDLTNDSGFKTTDNNTTYTFAGGTNKFTVTPSGGTAQTVNVTPSISNATTTADGLMSSEDKSKLDGIAAGAEVNIQSDWNATSGDAFIKNKPTIPSALSALTDDSSHRTVTDTEKAAWNAKSDFSGSYNDLTNKPTIPTVNNATLTIQKNGTAVDTFTANASSDKAINITISKSDVGLGNVDNTADVDKSVSHAETADSATKATQDGSGNTISETYLTRASAENNYLSRSGGTLYVNASLKFDAFGTRYCNVSGSGIEYDLSNDTGEWIGKVAVKTAEGTNNIVSWEGDASGLADVNFYGNATSATKATQDASGNVITSTYATKSQIANMITGDGTITKIVKVTSLPSSPVSTTLYVIPE